MNDTGEPLESPEAAAAPPRSGRRIRRRLLAGAVVVLLLDLAARLVLALGERRFDLPVPPYRLVVPRHATPGEPRYAIFDRDLGWTLAPDAVSRDGLARTNTAAIRADREYPPSPPPGVLRIAAFGDSFTHGDEVPTAASWPALLESWGQDLEVLNFGVPGYGTDQSLLRFRRDGRPTSPAVVLVGLLLENVGRNVNRYRPFWDPKTGLVRTKPRYVLAGERLELVPNPFATEEAFQEGFLRPGFVEEVGARDHWYEARPIAWNPRHPLHLSGLVRLGLLLADLHSKRIPRLYARIEDPPFQVTARLLETFVRDAEAAGAERTLVVLFPMRHDLERLRRSGRKYWQPMLDRLQAGGIRTVDLADAFLRSAPAGPLDDLFAPGAHYSPEGNRIVALALAGVLSEAYPSQVRNPHD